MLGKVRASVISIEAAERDLCDANRTIESFIKENNELRSKYYAYKEVTKDILEKILDKMTYDGN